MIKTYKLFFFNKPLFRSSIIAFLLLIFSFIINFYAGSYATERGTVSVTDIVLSNTRAYDVDWLFIGGIIMFFLFALVWCLRYPSQMPYIVKSIALFIIIRSIFVTLTHLWPYPDSILIINSGLIGKINFRADLFFSGHTWMPFLMALIFWNNKWLRYMFIVLAVTFGIIVLLWHLHYSIDVLAAFFITYTINHIWENLRKKDKKYFQDNNLIIYPKGNVDIQ